MFYKHWSEVKDWRWENFTPREIASKDDGTIIVNEEALDILQKARNMAGSPFVINSAYRSPTHNADVGGKRNSYHLQGRAFDISLEGWDRHRLKKILQEAGFNGIGMYKSFIHADTRLKPLVWGI